MEQQINMLTVVIGVVAYMVGVGLGLVVGWNESEEHGTETRDTTSPKLYRVGEAARRYSLSCAWERRAKSRGTRYRWRDPASGRLLDPFSHRSKGTGEYALETARGEDEEVRELRLYSGNGLQPRRVRIVGDEWVEVDDSRESE